MKRIRLEIMGYGQYHGEPTDHTRMVLEFKPDGNSLEILNREKIGLMYGLQRSLSLLCEEYIKKSKSQSMEVCRSRNLGKKQR